MNIRGGFIAFILLVCSCLSAGGQDVSQQRNRKARLEREIRILEEQVAANAKRRNSAETQLQLLQSQISARRELLRASEKELRTIEDSIYANQKRINRLQERLDTLTSYYEKLIRSAYKNRDARIWYMYILASDNISQALQRFSYLRNLSSQLNNQAEHIQEARAQLLVRQEKMGALRDEAARVRDERRAEVQKLQREESRALQLVKQLQRDKRKYQNQIAAKRKDVQALDREINRLIASAVQDGQGKKPKKPVDVKLSREFAENKGKLPWPAEGRVVAGFGQRNHPVYKSVVLPFNNGINIATVRNAAVQAVFDGVVRQVIIMPGYNQCVLVQHGNYFTFYCKLADVSVKAGQKVTTGQQIGHVVTIGGETQLHFQLWKGRAAQNPENWLRDL